MGGGVFLVGELIGHKDLYPGLFQTFHHGGAGVCRNGDHLGAVALEMGDPQGIHRVRQYDDAGQTQGGAHHSQ